MTDYSIETGKKRRDQRTAYQVQRLIGDITGHVLGRVADGLRGFAGHPKKAGQIGLSHIAAALGLDVHELAHPEIDAHIRALAEIHGVETPQEATLARSLSVIGTTYAASPVPTRGKNVHLSAVRVATGLAERVLKAPECQALLKALAQRNGTVKPVVNREEELAMFAAFAERMRQEGRQLPSTLGLPGPSATRVARQLGISHERFAHSHLADALRRLADEVGVEAHPILAEDIERFAVFVDAKITARQPVPANAHGLAYRAIAAEAGIAAQRIANNAQMQRDLTRWIHKAGTETK